MKKRHPMYYVLVVGVHGKALSTLLKTFLSFTFVCYASLSSIERCGCVLLSLMFFGQGWNVVFNVYGIKHDMACYRCKKKIKNSWVFYKRSGVWSWRDSATTTSSQEPGLLFIPSLAHHFSLRLSLSFTPTSDRSLKMIPRIARLFHFLTVQVFRIILF